MNIINNWYQVIIIIVKFNPKILNETRVNSSK